MGTGTGMIGKNGSYAYLPLWDRIGKTLRELDNFLLCEDWNATRWRLTPGLGLGLPWSFVR
jgi:hypothetical protein